MATTVLPRPLESQPTQQSGVRQKVILVLSAWFLLVVSLGATGAFVAPAGRRPFSLRSVLARRCCCSFRGCGSRQLSVTSCCRSICA